MRKSQYEVHFVDFDAKRRVFGEDCPKPGIRSMKIKLDLENLPDFSDPSIIARVCFTSWGSSLSRSLCTSHTHAFWELRTRHGERLSHTDHPAWEAYQELNHSLRGIQSVGGPSAQAKRDEVMGAQNNLLMAAINSARIREDLQLEDRSPDVDAVLKVVEMQLRGYHEVDTSIREQLGLT